MPLKENGFEAETPKPPESASLELKIRIEQSSGGSSPPPGTILKLRYVIQSSYLNEHLGALFLRIFGAIV